MKQSKINRFRIEPFTHAPTGSPGYSWHKDVDGRWCDSSEVEELESLKRCGNCEHVEWQAGDGGSVYFYCILKNSFRETDPTVVACNKWELCK